MTNILVVDDQRSIRNSLAELLELEGYKVLKAQDGREALNILPKSDVKLVITDIKMPNMDGTELLSKVKELYNEIPVIMISAHGCIQSAVKCINSGAADFIEKPIDMNRVLMAVKNGLERSDLRSENQRLRKRIHKSRGVEIIGESRAIQEVMEVIEKVAPTDARVLITGSNGTGKELAARQIHLRSMRRDAPFVEVNCAAIPSELIESELFGHEKGSFTSAIRQRKGKFEQAERGTIFLDEIGDMSLSAQAKVLRALQENKISRVGSDADIVVDVRVVAATNKDLRKEIKEGRFREDLYHRLSVIELVIPSLSERREDVEPLVHHFLMQFSREMGRSEMVIEAEALELLREKPWSGNIRELRNVVERLVILSENPMVICRSDVEHNMRG